ncbi:MAG TPA: hypothetical protein VFR33_11210 [Candidatus Dormibacteraeota bacterium]|nr:hypothetical protein [Candidatus Dormibacteraeota bacterium]
MPQPKGSRLWIYLTGVLLIIVIAGGGIWVRGQFLAGSNDQSGVLSSPTPLIPDYERADRFLNTDLAPALAATVTPLQNISKDCSAKTMTAPCKPDLIALNQAMLGADDALDQQRDIPGCIAQQVNQFKFDWQGMEQGVSLAISGYNNNSYDLYLQGLVKFAGLAQYLQADVNRINTAENSCAKTIAGQPTA